MAKALRALGKAWGPLLEAAVGALAPHVDLSPVWPTQADRRLPLERVARLLDLVALWNARVDLTAARDERELCDLYLVDALVLAARVRRAAPGSGLPETWLDVGSGAGAPGLVLQLLEPELPLTLVEPRLKRIAFLRTAVGTLGVKTSLKEQRSDALADHCADVAVSRATFSPEEWLAEGARLARRRVWVLLARATTPALVGWRVAEELEYRWPLTGVSRRAVAFERIALPE
jgi:16S rRNA (guanine527-N7)-methyltransferase